MKYWFHWINEEMSEQPNIVGAPKAIEADTPGEAWAKFHKTYPNLRDGKGDYYVMIRQGPVPKDDETDIIAEAGVDRFGREYFNEW